ncbi:ABC transporter ATP-binding protein [Limnothrix redekei]|uniref:ATP-binding cassette domain-containing protein n=1 Tax=Limnothrix redekei LRLZ20PSL1 TaxID=3112953 RepID=A0ABW7C8F7_9CYAN
MARVVLDNVYKSYPPRDRAPGGSPTAVLRRISLTIEDGEFLVLVGPSGCGKSTLLRSIAGLEEVTGGEIWVGDRRVDPLPPKARDVAMVFQSYALYPHLNVYDNIAFGLRRLNPLPAEGWRKWEPLAVGLTRRFPKPWRYESEQECAIAQQVRHVAEMLQIDHLLDRLPKELSGGQKQRVALGRAIARNPQVFLMDEPLSNLDAKLRTETRSQIVQLQRKLKTTTVYVTHDQVEAMTMGDRIAVLNGGQIQQIAPPLELYHQPANRFVAEFIGSPIMNFLPVWVKRPALLTNGEFRMTLPEIWDKTLEPYDGRALWLGVRPEHLSDGLPAPKNLPVRVLQVEALGSETYALVEPIDRGLVRTLEEAPAKPLQVRLPPDRPIALGDELWLSIPSEQLYLFDPSTGTALYP